MRCQELRVEPSTCRFLAGGDRREGEPGSRMSNERFCLRVQQEGKEMGTEIRKLKESDAAALWELRMQALKTDAIAFAESVEELERTSVEEYATRLGKEGCDDFVFGAFDGETMLGMTGFYREKADKLNHKGHVWGVFVAPGARGKALGRGLLEAVIQEAKRLSGLRSLLLTVTVTQKAARHMYERLGFRILATEPRSLRVGEEYFEEHHMILEFEVSELG
jgi:ribosomal protein S18 acetylase RimI-like enzyme